MVSVKPHPFSRLTGGTSPSVKHEKLTLDIIAARSAPYHGGLHLLGQRFGLRSIEVHIKD
jgi:hypothetical protein